MILQNDEIVRLFELGKNIKSANIAMNPYTILGSDEQFFTLRVIEFSEPIINSCMEIAYNHTELNNAIKEGYIPETLYNNSMIYDTLAHKCNSVNNIMNLVNDIYALNKIRVKSFTLDENDIFSYMLSKKAADGAMNTKINDICIYLSSTMFNKNKSDKVDLNIYSPEYDNWELAEFIIKKKKYIVKQYMKFLKL